MILVNMNNEHSTQTLVSLTSNCDTRDVMRTSGKDSNTFIYFTVYSLHIYVILYAI